MPKLQPKIRKCRVFFKGEDGRFYEGDMTVMDESTGWWYEKVVRQPVISNVVLTKRRDVIKTFAKTSPKLTNRR